LEARPKPSRRQAAFIVEPVVVLDKTASDNALLVDISGRNRQGLIHEIAEVFVKHKLSIHSAHAATYGMTVSDVFYVVPDEKDSVNEAQLIKDLYAVLESVPLAAPRTPARKLAQAISSDNR
jgi:[protein-PII] uridylyltransferase